MCDLPLFTPRFKLESFLRWYLQFMSSCGVCLCVRVSVCLVKFVDHVKTNKDIFEIFSPSGSHTILVFPYQTAWRYSDGNSHPVPNGGVECRWGRQKRDSGRISGFAAYRYTVLSTVRVAKCEKQSRDERGKRRALTAASVVCCSHKTTTKCLWQAWRYTPETKEGQPPPWS